MISVQGVSLGTGRGGISASSAYKDRDDVLVMTIEDGARVAGVFTRNGFRAAPVVMAERRLAAGPVRALLVNSGNANAATGEQGFGRAERCCELVAQGLGIAPEAVLPFSTGVIGEQLPMDAMEAGITEALARRSMTAWPEAAKAIMTTDTVPKLVSRQVLVDGCRVQIAGIAKGAGMIAPNMATMLAFIGTDARIEQELLQTRFAEFADKTFNRVTVDGDTSTNDACILVATGASGVEIEAEVEDQASDLARDFWRSLEEVMQTLARALIEDAEGGTKCVRVLVEGGRSAEESSRVARSVSESPLVKTALFAEDPNWGRVCMAVGNAGLTRLDQSLVDISIGEVTVMKAGMVSADYDEAAARRVMQEAEFTLRIHLGRGAFGAEMLTSDFSHEYVKINAEYRT